MQITTTVPEVLTFWDNLISFVLMTIKDGRLNFPEPVIIPLSKCDELENTKLKVENYYEADPEGLKFYMPLDPGSRVDLQSLLINAKAGPNFSFITVSKDGSKHKWSILRSR